MNHQGYPLAWSSQSSTKGILLRTWSLAKSTLQSVFSIAQDDLDGSIKSILDDDAEWFNRLLIDYNPFNHQTLFLNFYSDTVCPLPPFNIPLPRSLWTAIARRWLLSCLSIGSFEGVEIVQAYPCFLKSTRDPASPFMDLKRCLSREKRRKGSSLSWVLLNFSIWDTELGL